MPVIPFRQRHTGGESAPVLAVIRKAAIRGTFRAPSGRTGRMTGWLRLRRFVFVSDQLCAEGIFTGTLFDADGTPIGLGSRRHTAPAAVSNGGPEVTAVIGPVNVALLGLTVTIEAFELALREEMRPWSVGLEDPHQISTARPGAASHHRLQAGEGADTQRAAGVEMVSLEIDGVVAQT